MAEALGLISSIIAVIQLAEAVTSLAYGYVGAVKGARKEMTQLVAELGALDAILKTLQKVLERDDIDASSALGVLAAPNGPLDECRESLVKLKAKLTPGVGVLMSSVKSLVWPLRAGEMSKYLSKIERAKSIFILALTSDQMTLSRELLRYVQEIHKSVKETNLATLETKESVLRVEVDGRLIMDRFRDEDRGQILNWLSLSDPESNHLLACNLRQSGTGKWFLDGEEFSEWQDAEKGFSWLQAKPGAGKTILMSMIIDAIAYKYLISAPDTLNSKRVGVAFFYFDFKDIRKRTTLNMLGSLLSQFCQQLPKFPDEVTNLYNGRPDKTRPPLLSRLQEIFPTILRRFSDTYIFIDALDECSEVDDLLECISWLCNSSPTKFHIMTSSRRQPRIEESLESLHFNPVSIQKSSVETDVEIYVTATIAREKRLRSLDDSVKKQITEALVNGSHGMFRWAKAQLDSIRSCRTVNAILSTLKTLPKTLDETYEHILVSLTTEEDRILVRRALHWLVLADRPLTLGELAEAIVVDVGAPTMNIYNRLFDPLEVLDLCGSLVVRHGQSDRVELAHYSVQEYLVSERITQGPASSFAIQAMDSSAEVVSSCLTYLQFDSFDSGPCISERDFEERLTCFPLLHYAATSWFRHVKSAQMEMLVPSQSLKLLHPKRSPTFLSWLQVFCSRHDTDFDGRSRTQFNAYRQNTGDALYYAAKWGFRSTAENVIVHGSDVNAVAGDAGYPLHAATVGGHNAMVALLLEKGADTTLWNAKGDTALHLAAQKPHLSLLHVLANAMARLPNQLNGLNQQGRTALHYAAYTGTEAIEILLQAGASAEPISSDEETPLFSSLRACNQEGALELLKYGADPHGRCWFRRTTPLHMAARRHYSKVVGVMLCKWPPGVNITDSYGVTPLHDAIGSKDDSFGMTPWSKNGDVTVDILLRYKADVNKKSSQFKTPLDLAIARGLPQCVLALRKYGAVAFEDTQSMSIHAAAKSGSSLTIQAVGGAGCLLDVKDEFGYTALHFAAQKTNEGVRALLELGVSVNVVNNSGMTPLHFAAQNTGELSRSDIARDLKALETGIVDPQPAKSPPDACDTIICLLVAAGADIHVQTQNGEEPLDILRRKQRSKGILC